MWKHRNQNRNGLQWLISIPDSNNTPSEFSVQPNLNKLVHRRPDRHFVWFNKLESSLKAISESEIRREIRTEIQII